VVIPDAQRITQMYVHHCNVVTYERSLSALWLIA